MHSAPSAHWQKFIYRTESRHWHSHWTRYGPTGEILSHFLSERILEPLELEDGCTQSNIYHFNDARGTVSEVPQLCGPWRIMASDATDAGVVHPSREQMAMLLLPAGPSAWGSRRAEDGEPTAVELCLHHGSALRLSAGVIHAADGELQQLSLIKEDTRSWPSPSAPSLTESTQARLGAGAAACLKALDLEGPPSTAGRGHSVLAAGVLEEELTLRWADTMVVRAEAEEHRFLLFDDPVALVATRRREAGKPFASALLWRPSGSGVLYYVEASWGSDGALEQARHVTFPV